MKEIPNIIILLAVAIIAFMLYNQLSATKPTIINGDFEAPLGDDWAINKSTNHQMDITREAGVGWQGSYGIRINGTFTETLNRITDVQGVFYYTHEITPDFSNRYICAKVKGDVFGCNAGGDYNGVYMYIYYNPSYGHTHPYDYDCPKRYSYQANFENDEYQYVCVATGDIQGITPLYYAIKYYVSSRCINIPVNVTLYIDDVEVFDQLPTNPPIVTTTTTTTTTSTTIPIFTTTTLSTTTTTIPDTITPPIPTTYLIIIVVIIILAYGISKNGKR